MGAITAVSRPDRVRVTVEEGEGGGGNARTTANLSTKRSAQTDAAVFDAIQETTKMRFSTRDGQQVGDKDVRQRGSGKAEEASASAEAPALYREGRLNGTRTRRGGRAGLGWLALALALAQRTGGRVAVG